MFSSANPTVPHMHPPPANTIHALPFLCITGPFHASSPLFSLTGAGTRGQLFVGSGLEERSGAEQSGVWPSLGLQGRGDGHLWTPTTFLFPSFWLAGGPASRPALQSPVFLLCKLLGVGRPFPGPELRPPAQEAWPAPRLWIGSWFPTTRQSSMTSF